MKKYDEASDEVGGNASQGRSVGANVHGPNDKALEARALDVARECFGPGPRLEITPGYKVEHSTTNIREKRFYALITVTEVRDKASQGRSMPVDVHGVDAPALEAMALGIARECFGPGPRLEITPGYKVEHSTTDIREKRFYALITVTEISEPEEAQGSDSDDAEQAHMSPHGGGEEIIAVTGNEAEPQ